MDKTNLPEIKDKAVASGPVMSVLDLTTLINDYSRTLDELKSDLRTQRQMVKDTFEGDKEYHDLSERVKAINKEKNAVKQRLLKTPAGEAAVLKVNDLQAEVKDMEDKMSGYLQEYQRISGTNVIEGNDGELRQIIPVYRLVKKSKYNP